MAFDFYILRYLIDSNLDSYAAVFAKRSFKKTTRCALDNCFFLNLDQKYFNRYIAYQWDLTQPVL